MKSFAALALGCALVLWIACAGQQKPDSSYVDRVEISNLWTQIRQWRSEIPGMELDPPSTEIGIVRGKTVRDVERAACPDNHAYPPSCSNICELAGAICQNADIICTIADRLGKKDDYAQTKCTSAKASCRQAKQRCCGCTDKPADKPAEKKEGA